MSSLKKTIINLLPIWLKSPLFSHVAKLFDVYAIKSYSQEGEDMILRRIFEGRQQGFYVDVGAHHPQRFSNTYFFYKLGWNGINIEPNPDAIYEFKLQRTRDISLQFGISDIPGALTYYLFNEPALNTFDEAIAHLRLTTTPYRILETRKIPVVRLDNVFKEYLPLDTVIDFLSIDVEGFDLNVLKSNDWAVFRPKLVLVEILNATIESAMNGDVILFMKGHGYELFAKTFNTFIFREKEGDQSLGQSILLS